MTKNVMFSYDILVNKKNISKTIEEPLIEIWKEGFYQKTDWKKLKEKCKQVGIDFFVTVFYRRY